MLLGPQPGLSGCLQWNFSELGLAGWLTAGQIRSPESAPARGLMRCLGQAGQPHHKVSEAQLSSHLLWPSRLPEGIPYWALGKKRQRPLWTIPRGGKVATESAWTELLACPSMGNQLTYLQSDCIIRPPNLSPTSGLGQFWALVERECDCPEFITIGSLEALSSVSN